MGTTNKSSRIVVWTFLTKEEQKEWAIKRWGDSQILTIKTIGLLDSSKVSHLVTY